MSSTLLWVAHYFLVLKHSLQNYCFVANVCISGAYGANHINMSWKWGHFEWGISFGASEILLLILSRSLHKKNIYILGCVFMSPLYKPFFTHFHFQNVLSIVTDVMLILRGNVTKISARTCTPTIPQIKHANVSSFIEIYLQKYNEQHVYYRLHFMYVVCKLIRHIHFRIKRICCLTNRQ